MVSVQITLLSEISDLKAYKRKLVRFRGMIQDILNPTYYLEKCKVYNSATNTYKMRSGKYRDYIECEVLQFCTRLLLSLLHHYNSDVISSGKRKSDDGFERE